MITQQDFEKAAFNNDADIVKKGLKSEYVNPARDENIIFQKVCYLVYLDIVKLLLKDKRVDYTSWNNLSLEYAIKGNHIKVVDILLKQEFVLPSFLLFCVTSIHNLEKKE